MMYELTILTIYVEGEFFTEINVYPEDADATIRWYETNGFEVRVDVE